MRILMTVFLNFIDIKGLGQGCRICIQVIYMRSNIEKLVKESGLRKGYLAEKIGVTVRQFRKYETGHSFIPIDKAYILAALLNCKVDDLYTREEDS